MRGPIERAAAALQEAMRELIPEDLARLKAEHDATHASGGFLMPDRLNSPVPPNLTGVVQDESVQTVLTGFPGLTNQELTNVHLLNAIAALSGEFAATNRAPNYLYWTPDATSTDPEWLTYTGALLRWEGT